MRLVDAAFVTNVRPLADGQIASEYVLQPVVFPRNAHGQPIGISKVWFVLYLEDGTPGPFDILITVTNPAGDSRVLRKLEDVWPAESAKHTSLIYFDPLFLDNFEKNGYYRFKFLASGGDLIGDMPISFRLAD